ncbi:glycosyl transferase, family 2 [Geotalea uraniireducens Rf4]|uniref:Glycosyl transferase, family 2 n=1 Tax=Geotalea uraniireducens (strain Rf4) TaxID=351605 RepID=A5G6G2_GEOUR|nr:glycosyl transferase, family 2 [Geotalea uraniireducens Rf4]
MTTGGLRCRGYLKKSWPGKPLISVIIPVLNRVGSLEETVRSVLHQQYDNVEIVVIDGGSIDGTVEIIKKYEDYIDYWCSNPDNGIYDAMNKGARAASGDWLYFLGSDDILLNVLHKVAAYLQKENEVYYGDVYLPKWHKIYDGPFTPYKLMKINIPHQATFYPQALFRKHSYDLKYKSAGDYFFNLVCYNDQDFTYVYLPILVAIFDDAGGVSATAGDPDFERDRCHILKEYFGRFIYYQYVLRKALKYIERNLIRKVVHRMKRKGGR